MSLFRAFAVSVRLTNVVCCVLLLLMLVKSFTYIHRVVSMSYRRRAPVLRFAVPSFLSFFFGFFFLIKHQDVLTGS